MTKPQNTGVGDVRERPIIVQQHLQRLHEDSTSSSPKRSKSSSLDVSVAFCFRMYLRLFLILSNCSLEKLEQISHGFSRVTQGSSPLLDSLQAIIMGIERQREVTTFARSGLVFACLVRHFYSNKKDRASRTVKLTS